MRPQCPERQYPLLNLRSPSSIIQNQRQPAKRMWLLSTLIWRSKMEHTMQTRSQTEKNGGLSSFTLHIIAMALMLCDHAWGTGVLDYAWLTWIGRIAFPIFAFMIGEGYAHTSNLKRYAARILAFALISEIPFNLMMHGSVFYPYDQNVMWTFLIAIGCLKAVDGAIHPAKPVSLLKRVGSIGLAILAVLLGYILSILGMTDYNSAGVLTVVMFYIFRGSRWDHRAAQFLGLYNINCVLLGGLVVPVTLFGHTWEIAQQSFALFALIPIWLYRGRRGPHCKLIQYGFYAFYPVHILLLALIALL